MQFSFINKGKPLTATIPPFLFTFRLQS